MNIKVLKFFTCGIDKVKNHKKVQQKNISSFHFEFQKSTEEILSKDDDFIFCLFSVLEQFEYKLGSRIANLSLKNCDIDKFPHKLLIRFIYLLKK